MYNLVMTTREFGTGLVINGGHAAIKSQKLEFESTVAAIRQGKSVKEQGDSEVKPDQGLHTSRVQ